MDTVIADMDQLWYHQTARFPAMFVATLQPSPPQKPHHSLVTALAILSGTQQTKTVDVEMDLS